MATLRVRVNPAGNGEFAIHVDPEDSEQPWVRSGAGFVGWEHNTFVAEWPEFELPIPTAGPECPASPDGRHCRSATGKPFCQFCGAPM